MKKQHAGANAHLPFLDAVRGVAVYLMVFFHITYDLTSVGLVNPNFSLFSFMWCLPRFIVTLFLLSMGMSMSLSYKNGIDWVKVRRRALLISFWAAMVSVATYLTFPEQWIFFGTLHNIALSGILCLPLLKRPRLALALGLTLLSIDLTLTYLLPTWDFALPYWPAHKSMDYIPVLPWTGVVMMGIFLESKHVPRWPLSKLLPWPTAQKVLCWPGRHSLAIYITHQLLLYPLSLLLAKIAN